MNEDVNDRTCTAFAGNRKVAAGSLRDVASRVKHHVQAHPDDSLLIFDDGTGQQVELDLRGSLEDVLKRLPEDDKVTEEKAGPGRPRLGVISREIGLLPRHWDWLALQPGGASVTLRKLVEEARKQNKDRDAMRQSQNAAYRIMAAMAGNLPHFEEASRAFFARKKDLFETLAAGWPEDIRAYILTIGAQAFESAGTSTAKPS